MENLRRGLAGTSDTERQIVLLQSLLAELGYAVSVDGRFGDSTEAAIKAFQAANGLLVDGVVGDKTWSTLISQAPDLFKRIAALWLKQADLDGAANKLGVERAAVKAVYDVEAQGAGFLGLKPKILFEGHVFWQRLKARGIDPETKRAGNEDILYPKWTTQFYKGGLAEYDRLERAKAIHQEAALESASWGLFQILGREHQLAGYGDVRGFVADMQRSEREQLGAFTSFISGKTLRGRPLKDYLAALDWPSFAYGYNGEGYARNRYDEKLKAAYERAKSLIG